MRLESNQVDSIDYDSYENAPVDDFYISYDGSFRSEVGTYQFDKGGYDDLIGNRQSISPYDFMGSGAHAGYVFFFVPKEAENIAFFYSIADTDSRRNSKVCERAVAFGCDRVRGGDDMETGKQNKKIIVLLVGDSYHCNQYFRQHFNGFY